MQERRNVMFLLCVDIISPASFLIVRGRGDGSDIDIDKIIGERKRGD